jgi:predicted FMN-binding regulatory protein PaiB
MSACVVFATLAATPFATAAVSHRSAATPFTGAAVSHRPVAADVPAPFSALCADAKAAVAKDAALRVMLSKLPLTFVAVSGAIDHTLEAHLALMNSLIDTDLKKACGI